MSDAVASANIVLMQPTSAAQFAAAQGTHPPQLEQVRDGLWALGVPMPALQPHFTLSYLAMDFAGDVHLIDPGWDTDDNWQRLCDTIAQLGASPDRIATVTVTHLHPDHLGMAERVRAHSGAVVALHRAEQEGIHELRAGVSAQEATATFTGWGAPAAVHLELLEAAQRRSNWKPFTADRLLDDGDSIDIPGHELRVVHTPGHTTGHIALLDADQSLVFTGDLLLPNQFPGIGLGGTSETNPIDDYLASLHHISQWADHEVLPGHGFRFTGLAERCATTRAHHDRRTAEVATVIKRHPGSTVWDTAQQLTWTGGWANLRGLALLSALTQTATHADRARADQRWIASNSR